MQHLSCREDMRVCLLMNSLHTQKYLSNCIAFVSLQANRANIFHPILLSGQQKSIWKAICVSPHCSPSVSVLSQGILLWGVGARWCPSSILPSPPPTMYTRKQNKVISFQQHRWMLAYWLAGSWTSPAFTNSGNSYWGSWLTQFSNHRVVLFLLLLLLESFSCHRLFFTSSPISTSMSGGLYVARKVLLEARNTC